MSMNPYSDALLVQDACNFSGVVHAFSRALESLNDTPSDNYRFLDSKGRMEHPVAVLFMSKLCSLVGEDPTPPARYSAAYEECQRRRFSRATELAKQGV